MVSRGAGSAAIGGICRERRDEQMIDQDKLEALRREYEEKLRKMQQPCQARAMNSLMDASEDEIRQFLGEYYDSPDGRRALGQESKG